jgi:D-hexose-6-phosphate mutarotase
MNTNDTNVSSPTAGRVTFLEGQGGLPKLQITTAWSTAEIYLHGAHVTHFQKHEEPPLLFLSAAARFAAGEPIRGGVPVIFPWFGPRAGAAAHGTVRKQSWRLQEIAVLAGGGVQVRLEWPGEVGAAYQLQYVVTIGETLTLELLTTNLSATEPFQFEECLHTYFTVGDISAVTVTGLQGVSYLDNLASLAVREEVPAAIRFAAEVDRVYFNAPGTVEIYDAQLGRVIRVAKEHSASTVVWNPWIAKAQQMADFGDEEYRRMVCVESGNVKANQITLPPGGRSALKVGLSSAKLA